MIPKIQVVGDSLDRTMCCIYNSTSLYLKCRCPYNETTSEYSLPYFVGSLIKQDANSGLQTSFLFHQKYGLHLCSRSHERMPLGQGQYD